MIRVSTKELLPALGGIGSPVRAGLLAGANGHLPDPRCLGMGDPYRRVRGGRYHWLPFTQTLQGHSILREEVRP